jgi:hypothetical protein
MAAPKVFGAANQNDLLSDSGIEKQNQQKMKTSIKLLSILTVTCALAMSAQAQIGSGWTVATFSERFEYESNDVLRTISPPPSSFNNGSCEYDNTAGVETFQLLNSHSNRGEIRPNDDASTGSRQFEADILISSPSDGESIHQIFNGPTGPWLIVREQSDAGGSIRMGGETSSGILASNLYGTWFRMNSINDMNSHQTYIYINGVLKWTGTNPGGTFYTKYGCYGTLGAASAKIQFKNVRLYSGGTTNQGFTGVYEIQNVTSGKVLNQGGSTTNGSPISQWTAGSSDNLKFTFIPTSGGYYQINSVKSGKDVVVQSASTASGANLIQWTYGSSGNDQWKPVQNSDGTWTFFNLHSGLVLNNTSGSLVNGSQYSQWTWVNSPNEKFNLLKQ